MINPILPNTRSWVETEPDSHFPIQNLPLGVGQVEGATYILTRIGDFALNLGLLLDVSAISLSDLSVSELRALRMEAFRLLQLESEELRDNEGMRRRCLVPIDQVRMVRPYRIPQFVDFYAGIHHASNVGRMFRPDMPPLLPNYRYIPVGYNGRASSILVSGEPVRRPSGQSLPTGSPPPSFGPTAEMDFELELGAFLGEDLGGSDGSALASVGGFVLVNDWSARDFQRWEYQPLGPFLAKSFATSISPWVVLPEALAPFWVFGEPQDPLPLPHLRQTEPGHLNLELAVTLRSARMTAPQLLSRSNARHLYWSFGQLLAHQASNGTPLECGDLYASGTISGPDETSLGSLLELTWRGTRPLTLLETGETRTYLEDGDTVTFSAYGQAEGYRIGFGDLTATVVA